MVVAAGAAEAGSAADSLAAVAAFRAVVVADTQEATEAAVIRVDRTVGVDRTAVTGPRPDR